ncbi:MAG: hypothetical protein U0Q15_12165 [Kineosporiaceae bacterium]
MSPDGNGRSLPSGRSGRSGPADGEDRADTYDEAYDTGVISEVIRPAAVVPEDACRAILVEMSLNSATAEGLWVAEPSRWNRYDRPWSDGDGPGEAKLLGTIQVAYGTPTRYEITIYRVTITTVGSQLGWTVQSLCNEALSFGDITLADCPRVQFTPVPKPHPDALAQGRRRGLLRHFGGQG